MSSVEYCILFFMVLIVLGGPYVIEKACRERWQQSGMKAEWGLLKGCVVQRADGTWIPDSAYREIER